VSLGRRALEAARRCGLDWLPGMLADYGEFSARVLDTDSTGCCLSYHYGEKRIGNGGLQMMGALPDLSDTLTALAIGVWFVSVYGEGSHIVVERGGEDALVYVPKVPMICTDKDGSKWPYFGSIYQDDEGVSAATRLEAAVLALEFAAERTAR
jgi:hypothetical protein